MKAPCDQFMSHHLWIMLVVVLKVLEYHLQVIQQLSMEHNDQQLVHFCQSKIWWNSENFRSKNGIKMGTSAKKWVTNNKSYPFDSIEQKSGTIWMTFCPCNDWFWIVTIDCCLCHHVKGHTKFLGNEIFDNRIITRFLISKFIGWEGNNSETIFLIFIVKFL